MPRMELTLKIDYLPGWDYTAGIREFVQNARDAEVQFDAPMKIDWYNNTLRIENEGTTLPREVLLFGHTTKFGMSEMIGKFGEGLKLGTLALIRQGYPVKIRSGSEVWEPTIEKSDKFNAKVLCFHIHEGRKPENRVRIEIGNISKEVWETLKERFLFLDKEDATKIQTSYGTLLLDPKYSGKVHVKGIFVQQSEMHFGYDLTQADLDRDRKMVDSYDQKYHTNRIWAEALNKRPELLDMYFLLFDQQKADIEGVDSYSAQYLSNDVLAHVSAKFVERYGKDAIPVANLEESRDIEHYGKKGIVVTKQLGSLLTRTMGDFKKVRESLRNATSRQWSWAELVEAEKETLVNVMSLIEKASDGACKLGAVDVVEFMSPELEGLYKDKRVQLRKSLLGDFDKTLQVLIHEFAHSMGGDDGDKSHVANIEKLWMSVFKTARSIALNIQ